MNTSAIPFYTTTQNPYNLTLNDGQSQIITWSVNATGSIDNTYLFYVYANRISDMGIGNTTSSWNVTITNDTGAVPTISIIYPVNGANYSSDVTDLNYSVSGNNLSRCWYSINNGVTNSSDVQNGTNFIGLTSNEGSNTWYVYCNNTNGNISSSSVTFNKDTGYPSLSNYWDNNGTITSSGVALFNATVLNTNGTVWLSINGTNYSATNNSNIYNVSVSLTTGSYDYIWYAYGNGTSRNLNNSVSRTYVVLADSSIPQVGFVLPTPANGINSTNRYFEVNTSIFESSLNSVVYNWNGTNYTMYNSSLVLMMNFNNISSLVENSTKVLDFSRYQNNATLNGAALNSSGKYGGAVSFNGSANVYGRVQNSSSLNFTTFTVSAWINAASWKTNYWEGSIVNRDSLLVPAGFFLRTGASGTLSFGIGNTSGSWPETKSGAIMSSNRWYYVSGVYNGSSISIYINGSFVNSTAASNYNNTNAPIYIGNGYDLNRGFNGSIDEVRIWNRSLSAGEIYQQYVSSLQKIDSDQWYLYTNQSKNSTAGLDDGNYTYSVFVSDTPGNTNQTETRTYSIDNSPRVYLTCEAGGNYQQNALVLVNGRVTNRTSNISGANVNLSIFRLGVLNGTTNLTTVSDGSFSTDFAGLVVGSYILNGTVSTQSLTATCTDIFSVGGPASIIVDKIISLSSLANESASYNVTLNVINVGLSDSTGVILVDNDFNESPYDLGDIPANSSIIRSFIKSFERNSSTYEVNMSIASITATDSYSGDEINSNSSQVTIVVPSYEAQGLILVKNVYYNSENSTHVNYTISLDVINSGGEDLGSVVLIDSDLELSDTVSLLMGENYSYSSYVLIEKAASNTNKLFVRASAVANSVTYQSNQIQVRVPGYGGPADAIVNAPALVDASTDFDAVIQVLNMNPDIGQDFTIDYWITDKLEENNYSSGQKTIYVAASTQIDTNVSLTSPPSVGTYRLKVLVSWVGGTATAYDSFLVASIGSGINETENGSDEIEYHGGGTSTINLNNSRNDSISNGIVCNPPYIRYGVDCCLDVNLNKICDKDENTKDVTGLAVDSSEKDMIENNANRSFFGIITNQVKESSSRMFGVLEKITDNKNLLYIIIALLIVIVLLKMNIVGMVKNIVLFVAGFFARINLFGKKDSTHLTSLRGIKVYSSSGDYIGVVEEVYVETVSPRIYGYLLKLNKSIAKRIGKEKAIIKQGSIKSIGEVILLKIGSLDYSNDVESAERIVEEI